MWSVSDWSKVRFFPHVGTGTGRWGTFSSLSLLFEKNLYKNHWIRSWFLSIYRLQCSVTCGQGSQVRRVYCARSRLFCDKALRPFGHRTCTMVPCAKWQVGSWGEVSETHLKINATIFNFLTCYKGNTE